MKKVLTTVIIFFIAFGLYSQAIDTNLLDLSKAKVSIAGPQSVYIRSIYYNGKQLSVLLKYNGTNGATVYGPYYEKDKLLLDSYNLNYTKLSIAGPNEIMVSNLILGNQAYSGVLKWTGDATLVVDSYWKSKMPETNEVKIANLQNTITSLKEKYSKQISTLQEQIASLKKAKAVTTVQPVQKKPQRVVLSSFSGGKALFGNWSVGYGYAEQKNTSLKFAKYSIPLYQSQDLTSYFFTANAQGSRGWVGYGLHFFASGEQTGKGYGFGRSYLVWLTRDFAHYQANDTYLQLYESFNDVKMIQLASVKIPQSITSTLTVEALYNKSTGQITVSVNGEKQLSFTVESPIYSGNKIVLRTLGGPVKFTSIEVKTQ